MATAMFNEKTTADEVVAYFKAKNVLMEGKTYMVTGANCGLGLETARVIAANGGTVIALSRSPENGKNAIAKIKEKHPNAQVTSMVIDLTSLKSVRVCAEAFIQEGKPLHALINNAGIMACPKTLTDDGFESQIGVNHLGHFLLTDLLLPTLAKTGTKEDPARVINLSSMAHWCFTSPEGVAVDDFNATKSYDPWQRYGQSKLANVLHAKELTSRCAREGQNVIAVSVHPGAIIDTNLKRHFSFSMFGSFLRNLSVNTFYHFAFNTPKKSVEQGSATTLFATLSQTVIPGAYYEDCHLTALLNPRVEDQDLATRLWAASEVAVAIK